MSTAGKYIITIFLGIVCGVVIIILAEVTNFSHFNLLPFGGPSWALWVYPIAPSLGILIASFIIKVKYKAILFIGSFLAVLIFIYFTGNGLSDVLVNPTPFGKGI